MKTGCNQQMHRKPASFSVFAHITDELRPGELCLHSLPDVSSLLHAGPMVQTIFVLRIDEAPVKKVV